MNDYYLQSEYYKSLVDGYLSYPAESSDILSYFTAEEWANIVELITNVEHDKLSPKKQLDKLGFGMVE